MGLLHWQCLYALHAFRFCSSHEHQTHPLSSIHWYYMSASIPITISPEVDYNWWCTESCCNWLWCCAILMQHVACYLCMCICVCVCVCVCVMWVCVTELQKLNIEGIMSELSSPLTYSTSHAHKPTHKQIHTLLFTTYPPSVFPSSPSAACLLLSESVYSLNLQQIESDC